MDQSNDFNQNGNAPVKIWSCGNCEAVHLKAGNVLLNFTKNEFADLAYTVNDLFQSEFGSLEFYHLIGSLGGQDELLSGDSIS